MTNLLWTRQSGGFQISTEAGVVTLTCRAGQQKCIYYCALQTWCWLTTD